MPQLTFWTSPAKVNRVWVDKLGQVLAVVEETAGIRLGGDTDEVRSDYDSAPGDDSHEFASMKPAPA